MKKDFWKNMIPILAAGAVIPFIVSCGRNESQENVNTENWDNVILEGDNLQPENPEPEDTESEDTEPEDTVPEGYTLVWEEQFVGEQLNREDWNVETHNSGWVNNELQAYVDSTDNIYIEDGNLVLKPIQTVNADGTVSYTSGRVNTQNKHDFKYGLFEARLKVPKGQGFLPAFWMMPTSVELYGQTPRCGEIDIMEVMGQATDTSYGTIHFGNPYSKSQGICVLEEGSFSDEYHIFSLEWEPGRISWYVNGNLIHTENDWYSITEGQGEITYPAPFDQPFYIILNLAVGGDWVGYPDASTDVENAEYRIDYVRVYQKDSYDENVEKPVEEVIFREADENGNYIHNGNFTDEESLTDETDWIFYTLLGGAASATIKDNEIFIDSTAEGTEEYSVQLVQPDIPMQKGGTYLISFDAYADEDRIMKVAITAPYRDWIRYFEDTLVELTTEKQTFTYEFTMKDNDDAKGRLEYNMGADGSTAGIHISNVSLVKTGEVDLGSEGKTVLADGNYVYNGSFQEGKGRLGYWETEAADGAEVTVTNEDNIRKLKVSVPEGVTEDNPVVVFQEGLVLPEGSYALRFLAEGEAGKRIKVTVAGWEFEAEMTGQEVSFGEKFSIANKEPQNDTQNKIVFTFNEPGVFYLDDVRVEEDSLIKNGSFNAGFAGYEVYAYTPSDVTYVVDSLSEDNAVDFSISSTGDEAWKVQLKQNNIELEKGQWYRLSLDAKSDIDRKLMFVIQRDGTDDNDWTPYSWEEIVELGRDYQTYVIEFQMEGETDLKSVLSISMGAVDGVQINRKHRICIDNISLEKIDGG